MTLGGGTLGGGTLGGGSDDDRLGRLKDQVRDHVARMAPTLVELSHRIHDHPELAYEEHLAHDLLTSALADAGLDVVRGAFDLPTAFVAEAGSEGPCIAVLCEYDALPDIGHACGHNVIGTAGVGAGIAAAALAATVGGRVRILGTPAEEGGGGKILMAERGALDGVDAAMMVHPAWADLTAMNCVAIQQLTVSYEGRAAHAAAAPHLGRNALDAAVLGYVNVAALRQHIRPTERVHGVFTHGGDKPNIVPHHAETFWYVRSDTIRSLQPLKERVLAALQAGAQATGCSCTHTWAPHPYSDMKSNAVMGGRYAANAALVGRTVRPPDPASAVVGSTDMGNVSYAVPSIHPMIAVAPPGVAIHTPEFAVHARSEAGDRAVLDGAAAMAMTVLDLWADPALLAAATAEWRQAVGDDAGHVSW